MTCPTHRAYRSGVTKLGSGSVTSPRQHQVGHHFWHGSSSHAIPPPAVLVGRVLRSGTALGRALSLCAGSALLPCRLHSLSDLHQELGERAEGGGVIARKDQDRASGRALAWQSRTVRSSTPDRGRGDPPELTAADSMPPATRLSTAGSSRASPRGLVSQDALSQSSYRRVSYPMPVTPTGHLNCERRAWLRFQSADTFRLGGRQQPGVVTTRPYPNLRCRSHGVQSGRLDAAKEPASMRSCSSQATRAREAALTHASGPTSES